MRDLLHTKFVSASDYLGFAAEPDRDGVIPSVDGLKVVAVLHPGPPRRLDRRATLARMRDLRARCPRVPGHCYAGALTHPHAPNEEAPGAPTPRASV